MKKIVMALAITMAAHSAFAFEGSSALLGAAGAEIFFSTAMTSITSEMSTFSTRDTQKLEATKLQNEAQDYFQNGSISVFLAEKIAIVNSLDRTLSVDESVDVLIEASKVILAK